MTRKAPAAAPPAAPPRPALAALLLLAAAGLVVSLLLVRLHSQAHAGVASFCDISETVNCDKVATSPYSVVLRLPVALWGALGYGLAFTLAAWGLGSRRLHAAWPAGLLLLFGAAATAASVALALVSKLVIGAWCVLCMVSWTISAAMLAVAVLAVRGAGAGAAVRADVGALLAMPRRTSAALVAGLAAVAALAAWYPRYWERAEAVAKMGQPAPAPPAAPTGAPAMAPVDPAVGAVVYSDYECPYCMVAHGELKAALARRPDIQVVKRHFPLDMACNPVIKRPMHQRACEYARAAICAEAQGHLAAMDDALFENQRGHRPVEELARGLGLDLPRFQACLGAPATEQRLQADIAAALRDGVKATPTYVVAGVPYAGKLPVEVFAPPRP